LFIKEKGRGQNIGVGSIGEFVRDESDCDGANDGGPIHRTLEVQI